MVFLKKVRFFLDLTFTKTCSLIALTTILAVGCSGRGEKKVAISCPPGQSQGADGKCAGTAGNQGGSGGPIGGNNTDLGGTMGNDPGLDPGEAETTAGSPEDNPNDTPTPELTPGPNETPETTPETQNPPGSQPQPQPQSQPQPQTQPGPTNNTLNRPPLDTPNATPSLSPTPVPANDPINQTETVTTLFNNAPQTSAEGAPTLAFKLISSPTQGKVARVAFSHTNGVTNTEYKYHKKSLATSSALSTTAIDGSHAIELSTIPVSVTFEWNNKKCDSGLVEVDFEAKITTPTCK
jgi:hypothetical protein